jgi:hypothetical protein
LHVTSKNDTADDESGNDISLAGNIGGRSRVKLEQVDRANSRVLAVLGSGRKRG